MSFILTTASILLNSTKRWTNIYQGNLMMFLKLLKNRGDYITLQCMNSTVKLDFILGINKKNNSSI